MLNSGEVFAGFTVERLLGQGGMGSVYLARHPRLGKQTALKLLNQELFTDAEVRARFEREADLAAHLDHPNIVAVYDRGSEDNQLWISMQYIDGVDAATVDPLTLPPERAVQIIEGVAAALDYAHGMGVLHRDVKPANFLLARSSGGQGERVFLTDFGIARLREDSTHLTQTGMFSATLSYASPEQMTGAPLDNRTDQYSLACALYWLFTGMAPFDAPDPNDIIRGHLQHHAAPLAARRQGVNPAMDVVLARAMAKRPEHRFATCAEFAAAARRALTAPAPPAGTVQVNPAFPAGYPAPAHPAGSPQPVPAFSAPPADQAFAQPAAPAGYGAAQPAPYPPPVPGPPPMSPGAAAPPYGSNPVAPPPMPKQGRSSAAILAWVAIAIAIVIAVVIALGALVIFGWHEDSPDQESAPPPQPTVSSIAAATPPDPLVKSRRLFPNLVPQGADSYGAAYQGAECFATKPGEGLRLEDAALKTSPWVLAWECDRKAQSVTRMNYTILEFASAADARAATQALPTNVATAELKSGVPVTTHRWIVEDSPGPLQRYYHTAKLVVSFESDPSRSNYLVYVSTYGASGVPQTAPPSAENALTAWWDGAPL